MKTARHYLMAVLAMSFFFTSCSEQDEAILMESDSEFASLSFGPVLNDLMNGKDLNKQQVSVVPECAEDDVPAYVEIILSNDGGNVVGSSEDPFRIDLVEGQLFTEEVPELELEPGSYSLDYFAVYNDDDVLIWLAPIDGMLADFLDNPMPIDIELGAGAKKYVEVSVVCFDDRIVNEYGYLFFDLELVEAIEFCIYGNYCDEDGRHYPAEFSVDIWAFDDGEIGDLLYEGLNNEVALDNNGDFAGTVVCAALPDTAGLDQYYIEITLLASDANPDIEEGEIRWGVVTDAEVRALFDGEGSLDYYHFREGDCGMDDTPELLDDEIIM